MTTTLTERTLVATDRCDRCGAQAYVRVIMAGGSELLFCAHHGREYAPALTALEATIRDESERLDETQPTYAGAAGLSD